MIPADKLFIGSWMTAFSISKFELEPF